MNIETAKKGVRFSLALWGEEQQIPDSSHLKWLTNIWNLFQFLWCVNKRVFKELCLLTGNTVSMTCRLKRFICTLRVSDHQVVESTSIFNFYLKLNVSSSHCDVTWYWIFSICSKIVRDKKEFCIREPESNKCFPDIL